MARMLLRSSGGSGQSCRICMTRAKSSPVAVLEMPVTSCTSGESARFEDAAMSDRQYETKNCSSKIMEQTRMIAAIIAGSPPGAKGQGAPPQVLSRWHRPTPAAANIRCSERDRPEVKTGQDG